MVVTAGQPPRATVILSIKAANGADEIYSSSKLTKRIHLAQLILDSDLQSRYISAGICLFGGPELRYTQIIIHAVTSFLMIILFSTWAPLKLSGFLR